MTKQKTNAKVTEILASAPKATASFNYKARVDGPRPPRDPSCLRALAISLLSGGATLADVVELTEGFYVKRGKHPKTSTYQRAVELVRLVAKSNGYGLEHDMATGIIKIAG